MGLGRFYTRVVLFCALLLFFTGGCKKKKAFNEENGQAAEDVRRTQEHNDEVVSDINIAIMEQPLLRGGPSSQPTKETELCGVNIDSAGIYMGVLELNYLGVTCGRLKKTGIVRVKFLDYPTKKWKNETCQIKIEFIGYKVTHTDGRSIQFDGEEDLTNLSGNTWYEMRYLNASNLIQIQTGTNVKVTFDKDNTARLNLNRRLTFNHSLNEKITSCKIEGLGTSNSLDNLENWGQNRDGNNFTTQVKTPIEWKSSCGSISPVAGEVSIAVEGKYFEMNCKYGVGSDGEPANVNSCPFGWKVNWSYKKNTNTRVFAYN